MLVLLLLIATGAVGYAVYSGAIGGPEEVDLATLPPCGPVVKAPAPEKVHVNVYNATDRRGLAAQVAGRLDRRGFDVRRVDNDPLGRTVTGEAEVRHGDAGVAAARTVAAQVGTVVAVPDGRPGGSVDLVLGADFTELVPPAEAAAALSPSPTPTPAGC